MLLEGQKGTSFFWQVLLKMYLIPFKTEDLSWPNHFLKVLSLNTILLAASEFWGGTFKP
jgi:hypothetical protein